MNWCLCPKQNNRGENCGLVRIIAATAQLRLSVADSSLQFSQDTQLPLRPRACGIIWLCTWLVVPSVFERDLHVRMCNIVVPRRCARPILTLSSGSFPSALSSSCFLVTVGVRLGCILRFLQCISRQLECESAQKNIMPANRPKQISLSRILSGP